MTQPDYRDVAEVIQLERIVIFVFQILLLKETHADSRYKRDLDSSYSLFPSCSRNLKVCEIRS